MLCTWFHRPACGYHFPLCSLSRLYYTYRIIRIFWITVAYRRICTVCSHTNHHIARSFISDGHLTSFWVYARSRTIDILINVILKFKITRYIVVIKYRHYYLGSWLIKISLSLVRNLEIVAQINLCREEFIIYIAECNTYLC